MPFDAHKLKARVARQFSRAASYYDDAAAVQLEIAEDALQLCLPGGRKVLDIGCGTGRISQRLLSCCPDVIALDLAEGMLSYAREQYQRRGDNKLPGNIRWLAGDAESLPLMDGAVDRVFSSMVLQWCTSLQQVMDEIYRVLTPGGSATLAVMAQGSMTELSHCWQRLDHHSHVNQFLPASAMQEAASQAGFKVVIEEKSYLTWHSNVRELLGSIKAIGANVLTETANHSVINRAMLKRLQLCYQNEFASSCPERVNRPLPLTYHVCFLQLSKDIKQ
jgi:malonyl-CoA O-methyltransferase